MLIYEFLKVFGGEDEDMVSFYECDERESIIVPVHTVMNDKRYNELLRSEVSSWDYEEHNGERILCINYFRIEVEEFVEECYAPATDTTFIMKGKWDATNQCPICTEVVGFYCGEPDKHSTKEYIGKTKAEYPVDLI